MAAKWKMTKRGSKIVKVERVDYNPQARKCPIVNKDLPKDMGDNLVAVLNGMYHEMKRINATEGTATFEDLRNFYGNTLVVTLRTKSFKSKPSR